MSNDAVVVVGGGHAARRAAETLRELSPHMPITLIGEEPEAPYDRPELSKSVLLDPHAEHHLFVRPADWYGQQGILLRTGIRATSIDRRRRTVALSDGGEIPYGKLLIATGSRLRPFGGPVEGTAAVHYLRTLAQARQLRQAVARGMHIAVVGGGFIGLEVAAALTEGGCAVDVFDPAPCLLQRGAPPEIGTFVQGLHAARGVGVHLGTGVRKILGRAGGGCALHTDHGVFHADLVVVGIGVIPNTELAEAAGLAVDNGIVVDAQCRTADPDIFAAGEVSSHFNPLLGRHVRVESWQVAEHQPAVAAENLLGGQRTYAQWPWLWSSQYDMQLQILGAFEPGLDIVQRGEPARGSFCVLGVDSQGALRAMAAVNSGRDISVARRLMDSGRRLCPDRLRDSAAALQNLL